MTNNESVLAPRPWGEDMNARLIAAMNAARRVVAMYPSGHTQTDHTMDRVMKAVTQCMAASSPWHLALSEKGLSINDQELDPNLPGIVPFASLLNRADISGITLQQPDCRESLQSFLAWLGGPLDSRGQVPETPGILLTWMQFDQFSVTDEAMIERQDADSARKRKEKIWSAFVSHLGGGAIAGGIDSPGQMASAIRGGWLGHHVVAAAIVSTINESGRAFSPSDAKVWDDMLKAISYEERQSVLAETMALIDNPKNIETAEILLKSLSKEIVVEWVTQGLGSGKSVSPSLVRLMKQIAETGATGHMEAPPKTIIEEDIQELLNREDYESYVDPAYDKTLEKISGPMSEAVNIDGLPIMSATFEEPYMSDRIAKIIYAHWLDARGTDLYTDLGHRLASLSEDLVDQGWHQIPTQWLNTLGSHIDEDRRSHPLDKTSAIIEVLSSPGWKDRIIEILSSRSQQNATGILHVTHAIGNDILPLVITKLKSGDMSDNLKALLVSFGPDAAQAICRQMASLTGPTLVEALDILSSTGADHLIADQAKEYLGSPDPDIHIMAISALLNIKHPDGLFAFLEAVENKNPTIRLKAIPLAGIYKLDGVVLDLCKKLSKRSMKSSVLKEQEQIVFALGQVGDKRALETCFSFLNRRLFFNRKGVKLVKQAIFKSLGHYPEEEVGRFISRGLTSKDPVIVRLSTELNALQKQKGDTGGS